MAMLPNSFQDRVLMFYKESWKIPDPWNGLRTVFVASSAFRITHWLPARSPTGKNLADIAKKTSVAHFVYSSVGGAERNTGITPWETKWEIEKHIRKLGLPATIFRPTGSLDIYHMLELEVGLLIGRFLDPVRPDKTYQSIATDDIGAFVALAFDRPKRHGAGRSPEAS